ncbi:pirin family protein [Ketobacter sp. MCCC 1A13808]|uniref:pirin family protein n=1 Tax=Ketobacter sp. MCCC 1A13808 TaxID=2602738 RepID=UPI0012EBB8F5|nr:pirin family protein [Ketobacter sp. MCCC 1A13808]MVF12970.1 pirin family protein [Ketobacter sp. MCCC 1A13808]
MNTIMHRLTAQPASDGAGVKIKRVSPGRGYRILDPFLMLDELRSDSAGDYAAGFPSHPHRGFETITYMRKGLLEHQDHLGNRGVIENGGAQWMTAGRGVIHSEMPLQKEGFFHGFQLWLNLPANEKMRDPEYHNLKADDIPLIREGTHVIHVLGGRFLAGSTVTSGPIGDRSTDPHLWDIELNDGNELSLRLDPGLNVLLYAYEGKLSVNGEPLFTHQMATTESGTALSLKAESSAKVLLLAGRPLAEPVAQYGPFVMNTREQIEEAIHEYQSGALTGS